MKSTIERDSVAVQIDKANFRQAHEVFLRHMQNEGDGVPFTSFGHRFFVKDEVSYKQEALRRGGAVLCFEKWNTWVRCPGKITAALKAACNPKVFYNLMEYKYGNDKSSYCALYRLKTKDQIHSFEQQVHALYCKSSESEELFGKQFDVFAEYLRESHLGCKWDFIAYLIFMMRPERFFPIRSSHFQRVLNFYGVGDKITGKVTWARYETILEVADALKLELLLYGSPTAIEIQSYMWVISCLLPKMEKDAPAPDFDLGVELRRRQAKELEKQRIGLSGEKFVFESEVAKLTDAGSTELARRVRWISIDDDTVGYDVLSFTVEGNERHIEVKATTQAKHHFDCFWLSQNEVQQASTDARWTIHRVWSVDSTPCFEDLGNIVQTDHSQWERQPSSWIVRRR